jgi:formate dehydrogenase major subunit
VNPLRGQNNVQGACDMGSFPHELPGYRHMKHGSPRRVRKLWGVELNPEPGLRIPNMLDAAVDGTFRGIYIQGEDILQSDPDTKHVQGRPGGNGMRRRPRPVPERDRELRPCLPAGLDLPRKGRHLHQCRAPHQPRAQGDEPEERLCRLGSDTQAGQAMGLNWHYTSIRNHG